ncbi:pyridoxal phosphate-dependent aminotransferase [Ihubacter sp. rT4E-8]|uniref:pyridoxal phosphate-dependent aminotransferase n=1 Tax=unclassified Ihubacter TaxID=2633299 RepID=UPI003C7C25FA
MKEYLSEKSKKIGFSPIRSMVAKASVLDDVITFALGEPDFDTPKPIVDAAIDALKRGETHYAPNKGVYALRKAISDHYKGRGMDYDVEDEIMVTSGGIEALFLVMSAVLDKGDEVIISNPYWSNHIEQIKYHEAVCVQVPVYEKDGFMYDPENLKKAITEKTKLLILNSPSNPTGGVATKENLEAIARIAVENDILVISDDAYEHLRYDDGEIVHIASLPGMKERTFITNTFSKTYAMTGWRVGYACGPAEAIKMMVKLQENVVSCVNTPAQYGAAEALSGSQQPVADMVKEYAGRREILIKGLNEIDGIFCLPPKGAFYAFANITKTGLTSVEFADRLLEEQHVVVVPGSGFGSAGEGFVRISYATSKENIEEGLRRIKAFVENL